VVKIEFEFLCYVYDERNWILVCDLQDLLIFNQQEFPHYLQGVAMKFSEWFDCMT
jgi:hypothetical protein